MKTIEVELTFEELDIIIAALEEIDYEKNPALNDKIIGEKGERFDVYAKLCSRLHTIDNAHTVMLTAAMHDDSPNPFHEMFVEAGRKAQEQEQAAAGGVTHED